VPGALVAWPADELWSRKKLLLSLLLISLVLSALSCGTREGTPRTLTIRILKDLSYDRSEYRSAPGATKIVLISKGAAALVIEGPGVNGVELATRNGRAEKRIELRSGTYSIRSPLLGHREAGQDAVLIVGDRPRRRAVEMTTLGGGRHSDR